MPTPKRAFLIVIRCIPVVVALSFLVFYVGRARIKRSEMLSSSKNLRALSTAADFSPYRSPESTAPIPPTATNPPPASTPLPPSEPATFSAPPDTVPLTDVLNDAQAPFEPFRIGIFPTRPTTLGGSKSGVPVVETSEFLRLWTAPSKTTYHAYDLPPSRALPREVTFSDPSISMHTDVIDSPVKTTPASTTPAEPPTPPAPATAVEPPPASPVSEPSPAPSSTAP